MSTTQEGQDKGYASNEHSSGVYNKINYIIIVTSEMWHGSVIKEHHVMTIKVS
jgi:hypothetical protein